MVASRGISPRLCATGGSSIRSDAPTTSDRNRRSDHMQFSAVEGDTDNVRHSWTGCGHLRLCRRLAPPLRGYPSPAILERGHRLQRDVATFLPILIHPAGGCGTAKLWQSVSF